MFDKNSEILAAWSELFVAHPMAIKKVEKLITGKAPLGLDEYDLLLVISRKAQKRCRLAVLAEETLYTKSGVSRVAKRMLDKGYIVKEECEEDRRGAYAILTKSGISALKETWKYYSEAVIEVLSPCYDVDSARSLRLLLGRLIDHLREDNLVQLSKKVN